MKKKHGVAYNIAPQTFILPEDFSLFENDRENNPNNLWILKPSNSSCGRGIKVIDNNHKVLNR